MSTVKIGITSLPEATEVVAGDYFVIEDEIASKKVDFENVIWSLDNVTFASTLSAQSTNISALSTNLSNLSGQLYSNVNTLNSTINTAVQAVSSYLRDIFYPIGGILMSTLAANPATYIPGSNWIAISQGKFIAGVGLGSDQNGDALCVEMGGDTESPLNNFLIGERNHTLTVNEMPSHSHVSYINIGAGSNSLSYQNGPQPQNWRLDNPYPYTTTNTGGGVKHNNIPPFYGLYIWKRTS